MKTYRVLKEYDRFYLCESEKGYLECFDKFDYRPNQENLITIKEPEVVEGPSKAHRPVNTPFNEMFKI